MKTERFASIVQDVGKPIAHLLLIAPEKDKVLQVAVKTHRVVTVHQNLTGGKADYGTVGFETGGACQYFIFPKSLSKFQGARIVGIKYDLLNNGTPKSRVKPAKPAAREPVRTKVPKKKTKRQEIPSEKLVNFTKPELEEPDEEVEAVQELKTQVRRAMDALEQGKQVAAFNLLKRIIDG
jgi:hypothetical protein